MISSDPCPKCKHKTLKSLKGEYEYDHRCLNTKHVYTKYYSGFRCVLCGWTNRISVVK
jgi:hypothetical protein